MQKLWYLAVMGVVGCVSVDAAMAQTPNPAANKPALVNIDPRAYVSGASARPSIAAARPSIAAAKPSIAAAKPNIAASRDMAAAQVPAMRSRSTEIVDAATRAAAKPEGLAAANGASGGSIASVASMAAGGGLAARTTYATPPASIARLALQAPSSTASAGVQTEALAARVASARSNVAALQTPTVAPISGRQVAAHALAAKTMLSISGMKSSRRRAK
jgi:hypothetical protein